jgi:hypothetical protein
MKLAPVILFAYNRPNHIKKNIESLLKNKEAGQSDLFVFSDAPKKEEDKLKVEQVREYLSTITQFQSVTIVKREFNYGLGKNIIDGVTEIVATYGKVIVLEDDLVVSPYFLEYMNEGLELYENDDRVISIHGYVYPVKEKLPETFFLKGADCLGWGTWKRGWGIFEPDGNLLLKKILESDEANAFDYNNAYPFTQMLKDQSEGKNNSWAVRWYASAFLNDKYTLYPRKSLVYHAGGDGSGTNTGYDTQLDVTLSKKPIKLNKINVEQNISAYNSFVRFYKTISHPSILYRLKRKIKTIFASSSNN